MRRPPLVCDLVCGGRLGANNLLQPPSPTSACSRFFVGADSPIPVSRGNRLLKPSPVEESRAIYPVTVDIPFLSLNVYHQRSSFSEELSST